MQSLVANAILNRIMMLSLTKSFLYTLAELIECSNRAKIVECCVSKSSHRHTVKSFFAELTARMSGCGTAGGG